MIEEVINIAKNESKEILKIYNSNDFNVEIKSDKSPVTEAALIANEAGCKLIDIGTKEELVYNKNNIENNFFIASRNDLGFEV